MTLIPLEHPHRLASPAEAEAFYGGLRLRRVAVRGCHTRDPERIEVLVAAADPRRDHTISFSGGKLDDEAYSALNELCACEFDYFDLASSSANIRVWPGRRAWVDKLPEKAAKDFLQTKSIAEALARFHGICGQTIVQGHVSRMTSQTRAPLQRFLRVTGTEVRVALDVKLLTARVLTELFPGQKLNWLGGLIQVDFPDGRIHGSLKTPKVEERHRRNWHARIDKALRRAKLVP